MIAFLKKMFGEPEGVQALSPADVKEKLTHHEITLIDVREEAEAASARIEGAILMPLSSFDPAKLPLAQGKPIVFHCAGGVRSARAVAACQKAGVPCNTHMSGGIAAWIAAGLPTVK